MSNRPYTVGDIVFASDIALDINGEVVQLVDDRIINPAGYCFQWAKENGKGALWIPVNCIIRHATPDEIIRFSGNCKKIIQREIDYHNRMILELLKGMPL
jgi:hypothetical protein